MDSGCTRTIVHSHLVGDCAGETMIDTFDGGHAVCKGSTVVIVVIDDRTLSLNAIVSDRMLKGVDIILGLDVIDILGGVIIRGREARFLAQECAVAAAGEPVSEEPNVCEVTDEDFHAVFDGKCWTVEWFWKGEPPALLENTVSCYTTGLTGKKKEVFDSEVERWIDEGILIPWGREVTEGIIPMMAVEQPTKDKVRPVLDFRELNRHVRCHTGDDVVDVCDDKLRQWRRMGRRVSLVDLKSAYLQIRVSEKLWPYQLVRHDGRTYCLTRLGFGLNCAPRIMSKILKYVLKKKDATGEFTSSYIDDILVDEAGLPAVELVRHLNEYGLETKPPESLENGSALGLQLSQVDGELVFRRGNKVPEVSGGLTRRGLFSVCGTLVGHYPVAGWLRVACSFIKRRAAGSSWEDPVGSEALAMITEVVERVREDDPVRGRWHVPKTDHGTVWCDASSLAIGALLEVDGEIVEDAAWLRKRDDYGHINVAELEAVLKGINLALKWGMKSLELKTDSATVHSWVTAVITEEKRVHTKGISEMVVKRRLGIIKDLISEFGLTVRVGLVASAKNVADGLTRVKKQWLKVAVVDEEETCCVSANVDLRQMHNMHHMGVDRTLYLAHKVDPATTRDAVKRVVASCQQCQSIDPAPVTHQAGEISVAANWRRLAIDVTHYRRVPYLSVVDCGPSRFAIWKELRHENAGEISSLLEDIFLERGPVDEVLMDNSTAFRSSVLGEMLGKWNVVGVFRAAYRPGGNGIVERHHRTVKAIAERGHISPREAVFWYNITPRSGQDEQSVPQHLIYRYSWRHPLVVPETERDEAAPVRIGEEVWVKPPNARCTTRWSKGLVTGVSSRNNVSVDGMPRHILDVRRVVLPHSPDEEVPNGDQHPGGEDGARAEALEPATRRGRVRRPPVWMTDFVSNLEDSAIDE